jgi:hypothetical protein
MIADFDLWEIAMEFELSLTLREDGIELMPPAKWAAQIESNPSVQSLGLSLAQAKAILTRLQTEIVEQQITRLSNRQRLCQHCGEKRKLKDFHEIHYCSLFGEVAMRMPRWRACACCTECAVTNDDKRRRWISAELEFVQSQLAATIPYAKSAELLNMLLPAAHGRSISTVRRHTLATGKYLDHRGLVADEAPSKRVLNGQSTAVGLDGGYLRHSRPGKEQSFEVIAGRAIQSGSDQRSLAFVQTVDAHFKERVRIVLDHFGADQENMEVFTDGATQLRQWQITTLPNARHILDWYHLKPRVAKLCNVIHSKAACSELKRVDHDRLSVAASGLKWRLWHGRSHEAFDRLRTILRMTKRPSLLEKTTIRFIRRLTSDLIAYLANNIDSLPNYGQRYRAGQRISSAFVESAVNQLIDKRMSKSQQMRWDLQSAHNLLQVRVRVVDGQLRDDFARWHPGFPSNDATVRAVA